MYEQVFKLQSKIFKALAHSRRLEIVQLLRDQELPVTQIHDMLDLPQANVSQHLQVLRSAHVVEIRREGKEIYYQLADSTFSIVCDVIRDLLVKRYKDKPVADELVRSMADLVPVVSDPVCGMRVSPKFAGFAHKHQDNTYYFCASGCLKSFKENPKRYI